MSVERLAVIEAEEQRGAAIIAAGLSSAGDYELEDEEWEDVQEECDGLGDIDEETSADCANSPIPSSPIDAAPIPLCLDTHPVSDSCPVGNTTGPADTSSILDEHDPFFQPPHHAQLIPTAADIHPHPAVYLIYLLVVWLHTGTRCKLPFRACNAVLVVLGVILSTCGVILDPPLCTSLATVLSRLDVEPEFEILPVCPRCIRPYPSSSLGSALCTTCSSPLFNTSPTVSQQNHGKETRTTPLPLLRFPYDSLSQQLTALIPEIEDVLDNWHHKPRVSGEYHDHFDGRICQELPGPDDRPFFRPDVKEMPDGELQIGLTFGVDW